jgi:hypothetical protein
VRVGTGSREGVGRRSAVWGAGPGVGQAGGGRDGEEGAMVDGDGERAWLGAVDATWVVER